MTTEPLITDPVVTETPSPTNAIGIPDMPTLDVPEFKMPEEANVQTQMDNMMGKDSLLMQRAKTIGNQQAARMNQSRGSLAVGHATNAMIDKATPIATEDARTAGEGYLTDWTKQVESNTAVYNKKYEERLNALGYDQRRIESMIQSNSSLTTALMGAAGPLLNNTELSNSEGLVNWMVKNLMQPAQESSNSFVGGIYEF